jgi:hypothetical protein
MAPGVQRANELANRLAREIEEWGGQSDIKKSAHWQQLHSDYQDLIFELHQAKGVEGFRPGTAEMLHDLTGDVDPTSYFRNATPGILRAAQNMTEDLNAEAAIKGYDGPPIKFADTSKLPPAERRPIDSINEQLSTKVDPLSKKSDPRDRAWQVAESGDPTKAAAFEPTLLEDPFVKRSVSVGVPPSQLQIFDQLKTRALGDDVALRNEAINAISEQATNGRTKAIRDYSSRLLKDVATESFEADQRRQDLKSEASRVR